MAEATVNETTIPHERRRRRSALYERQGSDLWLLATVLALVTFGLLMVYSSTYTLSYYNFDGVTNWYFNRQLAWAGIGALVMLMLWRIDYRAWKRYTFPLMIGTVLLLGAMLFIGKAAFGASRWLLEGGSVQPSEAAKLTTILYVAHWATSKEERIRSLDSGLIPFIILVGFVCGLIVLQPSFSMALLIGAVATTMFFIAGADLKQLTLVLGGGLAMAYLVMKGAAYRLERLEVFQDPFAHEMAEGYQTVQVLYSLARGGLLGQGLGTSRGLIDIFGVGHTDAIMAVIGQELGLIACLLVLALFLLLAYRGFRIAAAAPDGFGMVLASGITCWMLYQTFINVAVVTNSIPPTGIPLPFISFGGSGLMTSLAGMGLLLSISRVSGAGTPRSIELDREEEA